MLSSCNWALTLAVQGRGGMQGLLFIYLFFNYFAWRVALKGFSSVFQKCTNIRFYCSFFLYTHFNLLSWCIEKPLWLTTAPNLAVTPQGTYFWPFVMKCVRHHGKNAFKLSRCLWIVRLDHFLLLQTLFALGFSTHVGAIETHERVVGCRWEYPWQPQ